MRRGTVLFGSLILCVENCVQVAILGRVERIFGDTAAGWRLTLGGIKIGDREGICESCHFPK